MLKRGSLVIFEDPNSPTRDAKPRHRKASALTKELVGYS